MEAIHRIGAGSQPIPSIAKLPSRVILALDHFAPDDRAAVERTVQAFVRGEAPATRLPSDEPFYLLRATPDLLVIVRHEAGKPTIIEDVATQDSWNHLVHAG